MRGRDQRRTIQYPSEIKQPIVRDAVNPLEHARARRLRELHCAVADEEVAASGPRDAAERGEEEGVDEDAVAEEEDGVGYEEPFC